jgi:ubiquinone/menaquinone biosynthesis C-methylase UbiE
VAGAGIMIQALPAWQSHLSIAAIGDLNVASTRALRVVRLLLCAINPGDLTDPSGLAAGVDVSSALIDVAKQRAGARPGIEFRIGDACAIPYPDKYFEGARSGRVFLFLPDRVAAIQEMKRVVKSGGRVCLIDTDFDSIAIYSTNRALTRKMTSIIAESIPNPARNTVHLIICSKELPWRSRIALILSSAWCVSGPIPPRASVKVPGIFPI